MKNWKYIEGAKTGNTTHSDKVEVIKRLLHAKWSVQEIYELLKKEGYEVDKNFIERIKTGNDDKTGAEEFFKKLSDDVKEREEKDDEEIKLVGNETYQHKLYPDKYVIIEGNNYKIVTDGKVEKSGKITDAVLYGINHTYKRVGNFKTGTSALKPGDRVQSYGVQGTVRKVEGENSDNIYGEPIIEVEWDNGTVKKVGEHYLRKIGNKVGNARYTTREDVISHLDTDLYDICKKVPAGSPSFAYVSELQKKGWDISTISKYSKEIGKIIDQYKVGNSKTGNATPNYRYKDFLITNPEGHEYIVFLKDGRTVGYRGTTSKAQAEDWCDWHDPKTGKSIGNKVRNKNLNWDTGTIDWDVANFNGKWYITKNGQKLKGPFSSMQEAERYLDGHKWELQDKYGNAKTGNVASEYEILKQDPSKMHPMYKKAYEEAMKKLAREDEEFKKRFEKEYGVKAKNEASDDKFAYVMREFDEGKLKTPDGKVVTDPAQAKAIAYSESKKTENGLARARNAIKKS